MSTAPLNKPLGSKRESSRTERASLEALGESLSGVRSAERPPVVFDLIESGRLTSEVAAAAVPIVWPDTFPADYARSDWMRLFEVGGFAYNGTPRSRPRGTITLFRGCSPERRRGMSWTDDVRHARRYAAENPDPEAQTYRLTVPWTHVLAVLDLERLTFGVSLGLLGALTGDHFTECIVDVPATMSPELLTRPVEVERGPTS